MKNFVTEKMGIGCKPYKCISNSMVYPIVCAYTYILKLRFAESCLAREEHSILFWSLGGTFLSMLVCTLKSTNNNQSFGQLLKTSF